MNRLDLVSSRRWFFLASGIAIALSLVLLAIPPTLRPGIEFTSGTTALLRFEQTVDQTALRSAYAALGHDEARVQSTGPNEFLIRTSKLEIPEGSFIEVAPEPVLASTPPGLEPPEQVQVVLGAGPDATGEVALRAGVGGSVCEFGAEVAAFPAGTAATVLERHEECATEGTGAAGVVLRVQVGDRTGNVLEADTHEPAAAVEGADGGEQSTDGPAVGPAEGGEPDLGERAVIEAELEERFGPFEVLEFASVSAVVSKAAVRNATAAVVIASVFIMGYIMFAFSSVPRPFRYASCAILALLHDVIIVLGVFSLFGKVLDTEVNLMFVTGLLTIIGFSVHDSIVVFDRIREQVRLAPDARLAENVNAALVQTLGRSLNTSVTLLLTVLALLFLGGVTIQSFLLVLLVGVIAGTYSSVAIAAQLLVAWEEGEIGSFFRRLRLRGRDERDERDGATTAEA